MHFHRVVPVSVAAAGLLALAACSGAGAGSPTPGSSTASATADPSRQPLTAAQVQMVAGARAAAAKFAARYFAGNFSQSWDMLSPAVRHQIAWRVWVKVHDACPPADAARARVISSITVFGNAAIVTTALVGLPGAGTAHYVFNDIDGKWSYIPNDMVIYHGTSISADIAAARKAGLCGGWKSF